MKQQQPQFKEEKITSPITGENNCFRVYTEPATIEYYLDLSSGYMSHSNFIDGSTDLENLLNVSPALIKELQFKDDETGLNWLPCTLSMGELGIIYPEGTKDKWLWKYAKPIDIPKEEQEKYPIPNKEGQFYTSKLDVENAATFTDFVSACFEMGIIKDQDGVDIKDFLGVQ